MDVDAFACEFFRGLQNFVPMGTPVGMMFAYARVCFLERILTMGVSILFIPLNEVVWSNSCDQFVPGLHIRHAGHRQCMLERAMLMASHRCVPQPRLR